MTGFSGSSCRRILAIAAAGAFASPLNLAAAPMAIHRVGALVPQPLSQGWDKNAFLEELRSLGYREGENLVLDVRSANGNLAALPRLAADLVRGQPEVIVAVNTPGTRAVIGATQTIPIVMTEVGDPVATGFVNNLAHPGGNVTGISNMCGDLASKRLSLLKEVVPGARRIAVLLNPGDPITTVQVKDVEHSAPLIGVEIRMFPVRVAEELNETILAASRWRADALMWLCGQQGALEERSTSMMAKYRLPLMTYRSAAMFSQGALVSYEPSRAGLSRIAADYVDRILKGAKPSDLPVEQPTEFDLVVNLKTAREIGVAIPQSVQLGANRVIK